MSSMTRATVVFWCSTLFICWQSGVGSSGDFGGNCSNASAQSVEYAQCLEDVPAYDSCPYPELCEDSGSGDDHIGLAFGLTIGAGLATTIGAFLPFIPFIKPSNPRYLAAGLGLAAGVMIYVSFTELWDESKSNFCCETQDHFDVSVTASFFVGIVITVLLDCLVGILQKLDCGCEFNTWRRQKGTTSDQVSMTNVVSFTKRHEIEKVGSSALILPTESSESTLTADSIQESTEVTGDNDMPRINSELSQNVEPENRCQNMDGVSISVVSNTMSEGTNNLTNASVNELFSNSSLLRMNAIIPETTSTCTSKSMVDSVSHVSIPMTTEGGGGESKKETVELSRIGLVRRDSYLEMVELQHDDFEPMGPADLREVVKVISPDTKRLKRMGILTGLAIGIHNFPEGLATFVATLSSPSLGAALAIAIALHNIPEGMCVSLPVYYATGSKWKAFLWAFISGISEPLGALLGWLLLKDSFGPLVYGIFFGVIAGMMVFISLKDLIPTALKFDKSNGLIVSVFLVIGMLVMALSLILFIY